MSLNTTAVRIKVTLKDVKPEGHLDPDCGRVEAHAASLGS